MDSYFGSFQIANVMFQRSLGAVYLIAFIVALNQFPALLGEKGLLPVSSYIKAVPFGQSPSIFYFFYSDRFFLSVAWTGIILSTAVILGLSERVAWWVSMSAWLTLWVLYLSIVNVGQTFYAFGWETMLCEAGFFAAFLGPLNLQISIIPVLALRWMLFRTELGAGLIKIRGDECWRNLTCLYHHFLTQPLPNPLSWYFYYIPKPFLKGGVLFSHFVQLAAPFGLFGPQRIAFFAGILIILHQFMLIISGNYSWLNWLTVVLALMASSDQVIGRFIPLSASFYLTRPPLFNYVLYALAAMTVLLSVQPAMNFFSKYQLMNSSYNSLRLVNNYGAFGTITKERYEVVIAGTNDDVVTSETKWKEYEFKAKSGDVKRMPPQIAPYHLRLDWLMWFLPFSVTVEDNSFVSAGYELWFIRLIEKLLQGDQKTTKLLRFNPFADKPPAFIRARYYLYQYTTPEERKTTGAWWKRRLIGDYLKPVSLRDIRKDAL